MSVASQRPGAAAFGLLLKRTFLLGGTLSLSRYEGQGSSILYTVSNVQCKS
jgi:hypothetical protein